MVRRVLLFAGIGIATAATAWAAPYFEFSPDYAQSLLVASAPDSVSQVFLPLNEYLAGIDLWVSNGGQAGDATFTLYSPTEAVLAVRTVAIPAITDSESGTRLSVTLPSQLSVSGGLPYRLRIATANPALRLYYAQQNRILAHNGLPLPAYTGGLARIGDSDQGYSFKFALTENTESSPPQISGVAIAQPTLGTVVISFNANEPVDTRVVYGESAVPYAGQYTSCPPDITACAVTLPVTPGLTYTYTLTARDIWGNEASVTGQFTATGEPPTPTPTPSGAPSATPTPTPTATPDTTSPVISNARAAAVHATGATIVWTTDEAAHGNVAVFMLPFLTFAAGDADATLELEHAFPFDGLQQGVAYRARIMTSDAAGNLASTTVDFLTGTPTPTPENPTPTPSGTPTPTPSISTGPGSGNGTEIQWSAPSGGAPTDGYRVDIIGADGKLIRTIRTTDLSADLGELPDGATVIVYGDNGGVYEKVAEPLRVRRVSLAERIVTALPFVLGGLVVAIAAAVGVLAWRRKRTTGAVTAAPDAPPHTGV